MLETLQQDYVRTARAKGLRRPRVVGVHVLRNSLIPVVTAAAPLLGYIITGSFIVENIFAVPGIGRYYVTAVSARDYSVVMGLTVLLSIIVIVANLVVDILYGVLDPRTREAAAWQASTQARRSGSRVSGRTPGVGICATAAPSPPASSSC
jgi:oligopeptide transport system permease protein